MFAKKRNVMKWKQYSSAYAAELRRRATEQQGKRGRATAEKDAAPLSADETQRLLHKREIHHIELAIQNEELAATQVRLIEDNFRRFLDESPLGVRIVTSTGETLYANRAILDIYGYDSVAELNATPVKKRLASVAMLLIFTLQMISGCRSGHPRCSSG